MPIITITDVVDLGDDVLEARGTYPGRDVFVEQDDTGADILVERDVLIPVAARGWVSATTNHYDPDAYYTDDLIAPDPNSDNPNATVYVHRAGDRKPDAKPRQLSKDEIRAYALGLLEAQFTEPVSLI